MAGDHKCGRTAIAIHGVTGAPTFPARSTRSPSNPAECPPGDILVELDTRQERAQLADAEAQRELAAHQLRAGEKGWWTTGVISRSDYDQASANRQSREAKVGELSATIEPQDHPLRHLPASLDRQRI